MKQNFYFATGLERTGRTDSPKVVVPRKGVQLFLRNMKWRNRSRLEVAAKVISVTYLRCFGKPENFLTQRRFLNNNDVGCLTSHDVYIGSPTGNISPLVLAEKRTTVSKFWIVNTKLVDTFNALNFAETVDAF